MNKKHTVSYLIGLCAFCLGLVLSMTLSNNNSALAQQSSSSPTPTTASTSGNNKTTTSSTTTTATMVPKREQQQNLYSMSTSSQNWTGSISLFSPIIDAFKSKINTTLNEATTNAIKEVGGGSNSSAVAAFIHPERGFLVYNVFVLDSNNNIHRVIVDPGNGTVLSNRVMSLMDMISMMHHSMRMGGMMMDHGMGTMQHGMMGGPDMSMMGSAARHDDDDDNDD
jgi:uncharacterized membrane protein YkoI